MYRGTITADFGGISETTDAGREAFGVNPGVEGLGFLFWRIRRNSLSLPILWTL